MLGAINKQFEDRAEKNRKDIAEQFNKLFLLQREMENETRILNYMFDERNRIHDAHVKEIMP